MLAGTGHEFRRLKVQAIFRKITSETRWIFTKSGFESSFVLCPHSNDLDRPYFVNDLINKPMPDVDSPGKGSGKLPTSFSNGGGVS
jgi:hypothetical protein